MSNMSPTEAYCWLTFIMALPTVGAWLLWRWVNRGW